MKFNLFRTFIVNVLTLLAIITSSYSAEFTAERFDAYDFARGGTYPGENYVSHPEDFPYGLDGYDDHRTYHEVVWSGIETMSKSVLAVGLGAYLIYDISSNSGILGAINDTVLCAVTVTIYRLLN